MKPGDKRTGRLPTDHDYRDAALTIHLRRSECEAIRTAYMEISILEGRVVRALMQEDLETGIARRKAAANARVVVELTHNRIAFKVEAVRIGATSALACVTCLTTSDTVYVETQIPASGSLREAAGGLGRWDTVAQRISSGQAELRVRFDVARQAAIEEHAWWGCPSAQRDVKPYPSAETTMNSDSTSEPVRHNPFDTRSALPTQFRAFSQSVKSLQESMHDSMHGMKRQMEELLEETRRVRVLLEGATVVPPPLNPNEFLSVKQAAAEIGVKGGTLRVAIALGRLRAGRPSNNITRIVRRDLYLWLYKKR